MAVQASAGPSYGEVIVEALDRHPRRVAFVHGDRRVTYAEAAHLTSRIMQVLGACGVGHGGAVALLSPNTPEVWCVQAAAFLLGARYTGLHPLGSVDDHAYVCADAEIQVLIVHPTFAEAGAEVAGRVGTVREFLTLGPADIGDDLLRRCALVSGGALMQRPAQEEDIAWLQYTGGTTGRPKGVMLSHRAMVQEFQSATISWGLPEVPRYLVPAPITHASVLPILPVLARGGTVVLHQTFDPDRWLRTVQEERITYAFTVPTMLYALLNSDPRRYDLSSLETILYGAAPISTPRLVEALQVFGQILVQGYGQTECVGMATTLRKEEHDPAHRADLLSSCGRAVAGVRVEVLDDDGAILTHGEVGEICVRSRVVMSGYWKQPEETEQALRGGWLHTGDLATRDEQGFLHIVDRCRDVIVSGGFNIYPREVEDVIAGDTRVAHVAVIGVPDDRWGEAVTAVVVPRAGSAVDVDALIARVRERKGPHQVPKRVEVVERLPTTPAGKIDKKVLRARYWSGQNRHVH